MKNSEPASPTSSRKTQRSTSRQAATGVLAHMTYFPNGHPQPVSPPHFHRPLRQSSPASSSNAGSFKEPLRGVLVVMALFHSYLGALFASMVVYRIWFHRAERRFPGGLGPNGHPRFTMGVITLGDGSTRGLSTPTLDTATLFVW